jgi:hypothetical protein
MKITNENCNPFGKCEKQSGTDAIFLCSENNKTYKYINKSKHFVVKIQVDECLIKGEKERKCDYLLLNCTTKTAYLIELKGSDLEYASKQVLNVLNLLKSELSNFDEIHARIVLSKVYQEDIKGENYRKLQKELKNKVKHKNILLSETI